MATPIKASGVNKMVAMIAGAVLVLIGLIGFAGSPILGIFHVNIIHNFIHLITGGALLVAAFANEGVGARMTLLVLGVVYGIVAILGFIPALEPLMTTLLGGATMADLMGDNVLHILLAVVFIGVPLLTKETATRPMTGRPQA